MAENSNIEWTDHTFNGWIGCTKISPGCDNCYAEAQDKHRRWTAGGWGAGQPRKRTSEDYWGGPVKWNTTPFYQCACGWRGDQPKLWREIGICCPTCEGRLYPARQRVFCASLADVFDNEVPREWRADLFTLIRKTPSLDWQLLTKRIGNARRMIEDAMRDQGDEGVELAGWPWPNVWLGATIVNQEEADRDIPKLLDTPARVRFLSMEPLLGPVDLHSFLWRDVRPEEWLGDPLPPHQRPPGQPINRVPGIDWGIVGGESGPHARNFDIDWARDIVRQFRAAGVPVMVKQLGDRPVWSDPEGEPPHGGRLHFGPKGKDVDRWPADLRVREFPEVAR